MKLTIQSISDIAPERCDGLAGVQLSVRSVDFLGLELKYRVWGDPRKPAIIFQHGGKDHGRSWDFVISHFVQDFCCIAPDLRGHGDSGRPTGGGYGIVDFVNDFAAIIADLQRDGIRGPYAIVGHSLGGSVTLHYAAAFPENVSVLVNIEGLGMRRSNYEKWQQQDMPSIWRKVLTRQQAVAERTRRHYRPEIAVQRLAQLHERVPQDMVQYLARHGLKAAGDGVVWKHAAELGFSLLSVEPPHVGEQLFAAIDAPVGLFYGGKSFLGPFSKDDERFGFFQDAQVHFYDDGGHWMHHEELDRFVSDLRSEIGRAAK